MSIFSSKKKISPHITTTDTKEEKIKKKKICSLQGSHLVWDRECRIQKLTNAGGNYDVTSIQYDWKIIDNIEFYLIPSL